MNLEQLKTVWQSAGNNPSVAETEQLKTKFVENLRRRHRMFSRFLVWVFSALIFCTGMAVYTIFVAHKVAVEKEWAVIPMLAIPWGFAIWFLLQFRRHNRDHAHYGDSILNTLRAALDENRMARSRVKRVGLIYLIGIPALALAVYQLHQAGKTNGKEIVSMLIVFGVALGVPVGATAFHYYRRLLPWKIEIESLLRHYDSEAEQK